jgi:hypothetical protein
MDLDKIWYNEHTLKQMGEFNLGKLYLHFREISKHTSISPK